MHELKFKLSHPVVEGTFDHGRQSYRVMFDGTLANGEIHTPGGTQERIAEFLVTVHPPSKDEVSHANGISVKDLKDKAVDVDVTFDGAIMHRLMNLSPDEEVSLYLRFADDDAKDSQGVHAFEVRGADTIFWYANRVTNVPHVFCSITIERASPRPVTAGSLHFVR